MKIGITGADGLLGYHLRALAHAGRRHEVRLATRETFSDTTELDRFVDGLDGIVHFAGVNRAPDVEVESMNERLAHDLVAALVRTRARPGLVYANSTHIARDTPYGRGKRKAGVLFERWAGETGICFTNLVLPHVFGEFGRPFYNSVVSTFCHQLAANEQPAIQVDGDLELVHAQDVAARCLAALESHEAGVVRLSGATMKVGELLVRLKTLNESYRQQCIPDVTNPVDLRLFNTLRSYLYPGFYPAGLTLREDQRGALFEAVKSHQGGQTFFSSTHPDITRGNHFHLRKIERFLVVQGEAEIRLRRLFSSDIQVFRVSGKEPCFVDMPTLHTHAITNTGTQELLTMFWSNEFFDPADPDTYAEAVSQ